MASTTETAAQEHRCLRCGRKLRASTGYGPKCAAKIRAAAKAADLAEFTARQLEQARELIEDAAIVPAETSGQFHAVSSDGSEIYLVSADDCTCPASKPCYHQAAIAILAAA